MPRTGFSFPCMRASWVFLSAALLLFAATGQEAPAAPEFHPRIWRTDEGLPHNNVSRVVQDRENFIWIATVGGLTRFDGREFKEFKIPAKYSSSGYNIRGLALDNNGALLILPTNGALLSLSNGEITVHPMSRLLESGGHVPADVFVEPSGAIWIGTYESRLLRWAPDGSSQVFGEDAPLTTRGKKITFAISETGETWIALLGSLAVFRDGRLQPQPETPAGQMLIAQGAQGRIWVCTLEGLYVLEQGRLRLETSEVPWRASFGPIRHIHEDSQGALWIARSRGGLLRYANGLMDTVDTPFNATAFVTEDREKSLWVASDGNGVGLLRPKSHHVFDTAAGLGENTVSAICGDPAGRAWVANRSGGLRMIDADGMLRPEPPGEVRIFSNTVTTDQSGRVWFGGGQDGLYRTLPEAGLPPERLSVRAANLHLLYCARNGDVWFAASDPQLGFYRGETLHLITANDGLTTTNVYSIAEDTAGTIWLGGANGELMRWDGRKITRIDPTATTAGLSPIHDLYADGPAELWIATASGLIRREGDKVRLFTEADGLADSLIMQIVEDNFGRLWFASRRGLFCVSKAELRAVFRGEMTRVASRQFGRDQGLTGLTPTANYFPKTMKSHDGRLWFSTAQGAVVIDPSTVARDLPPPPVLIHEVRCDGRIITARESSKLPSSTRSLEFHIATPTFFSPENVQVNHRMTGFDHEWQETGVERTARYTSLPAGSYKLEVIARHKTGEWTPISTVFAFVIVPAWWETHWFRAGMFIAFTALIVWLVRTISQRVLKSRLERLEREHALEKERTRIARDLHDDLGSGLTELGMFAERIANAPPAEAPPLLHKLAWRTRRLAAELGGIVWTINGANGRLDQLATFLSQYAHQLFRHSSVTCIVHGKEGMLPIPIGPEHQHQILTTFKEALNNILKHARATEAVVAMSWADGVFELSVRDNGSGFDVGAVTRAADGNGLRNMRSRLHEIDGTFSLESAPGSGTTVILRLPCRADFPPKPRSSKPPFL